MQNSILGKGVKVAVFDTGVPKSHPHFKNIKDRTDWTDDKVTSDGTLIFYLFIFCSFYEFGSWIRTCSCKFFCLFVLFCFCVCFFCFVFPSHWDTDLCTLNRLCLAVGEINLFLILQPLNHTWCDVHLSPLPLLSPWTIFF